MAGPSTLRRAVANPGHALSVAFALAKGYLVKARFLMDPRVTIGPGFRAFMIPRIIGPGRVIIGAHVSTSRGFLRRPCILTHSRDSLVSIGNGSTLGGSRISCVENVHIGKDARLASVTILDSDVIPHGNMAVEPDWRKVHARPVKIGNRVWAGINSFILPGAVIGDECAIGAGAVVQGQVVPERSLLVGNPARRIGETRSE
jgi:acetyltransferase-like isoleucine patch superfamily enzyme